MAKTNDPSTWTDFDSVLIASPAYDGIGFVFSGEDPYTGIDLDGCRDPDTGKVADWAVEIIKAFDSYSEVSPSMTGVKIWIRAKWKMECGKKISLAVPKVCSKEPGLEVYDHARYFAMTGLRLATLHHDIQPRQQQLDALYEKHFKPFPVVTNIQPSTSSVVERARKYLATLPPAISGSGGHNSTFHAACILVLDFELSKQEAFDLLWHEYNPRCNPPWKEREIWHKIESAQKTPGPRGRLRDKQQSEWRSVSIAQYVEPKQIASTTLEAATSSYLDRISVHGNKIYGLGLPQLDYAIGGGVEESEMTIIAARPSHGKSAFALQCLDCFTAAGMPSAIMSEEMSAIALGKRTVQYASSISEPLWISKMDSLRDDMRNHFSRRAPCYVVENCGSANMVAETAKTLVDTKGVKAIAVDYAQLLRSPGHGRYEQITQTSITLRRLANETKTVLLVVCQLSRAIESRDRFIPRLEDLKDSGQLEQDADVIMFLVWPYRLDPHKNPESFEIWIGKNRNRPINAPEVDCRFNPSRQTIVATAATSGNVHYTERWNQALGYPD